MNLTVNHNRSESGYSNNYSLLEMYGASDEEDKEEIDDHHQFDNVMEEIRANSLSLFVTPLNLQTIPKILSSDYDRYGFKKASLHQTITRKEYNEWFTDYSEYSLERMKKWKDLVNSSGIKYDDIPTRFPPKSDKTKKLIRRGIPSEWRGNAWFFYAGGYERLNKHVGVYDKIVKDTIGVKNKDTEAIERDLNRTFPDNIHFNNLPKDSKSVKDPKDIQDNDINNKPMIKSLRRVLVAFSHYQPQIGYCQSLNFLAGLLLLFMNEERAFWMLVILTERILPKVHSRDLDGVHIDQGVLMLCFKEYIPQLWNILGKNFEGEVISEDKILTKLPPVTLVTSSWFMSVFVGIIPIEAVLRIWDILWYEGSKTLFRFSLTICKYCLDNKTFKAKNDNDSGNTEFEQIEIFQFMQSYPKSLIDPNKIVDLCFKKIGGYGFGSISQDEINKCRIFVSKQRDKMKKKSLITNISEDERKMLNNDEIHDIYGFNRSIMNGVKWNNNISNKMKKRFSRKTSK